MGVECAVCAALSVGARAARHQCSARHRLPRDCGLPDHQAGFTGDIAQTGAVTLIQRFGSALNLNLHFHRLFLDGVYCATEAGPSFHRVAVPTHAALEGLPHTLSDRIARHLERRGWWVRDDEHGFLTLNASDDSTLGPVPK